MPKLVLSLQLNSLYPQILTNLWGKQVLLVQVGVKRKPVLDAKGQNVVKRHTETKESFQFQCVQTCHHLGLWSYLIATGLVQVHNSCQGHSSSQFLPRSYFWKPLLEPSLKLPLHQLATTFLQPWPAGFSAGHFLLNELDISWRRSRMLSTLASRSIQGAGVRGKKKAEPEGRVSRHRDELSSWPPHGWLSPTGLRGRHAQCISILPIQGKDDSFFSMNKFWWVPSGSHPTSHCDINRGGEKHVAGPRG